MATQPTPPSSSHDLDVVLQIISDLARKSAGGSYVYRGEHKVYCRVSSSLYRRYEKFDEEGSAIGALTEELLEQAIAHERHLDEMGGDEEVFAQLRHDGGATNEIDFTNDYLVALFFACDGAFNEPGQIHMLAKNRRQL